MSDTQKNTNKKKRKRIIRMALFGATVISLFFVPWLLVWAWILPLPDSMQEQADQAVDYGFEGVILYVDVKGESPEYYTAGWHNRTKKIPAREDAYFKIGSISKLYDAAAVTKLVSEGHLNLDGTLADYLPELKGRIAKADQITLRMLVQHRSGIPNYTDTPDYWAHPKESREENLRLILDQPANFEPGEKYEYCNTNYLLLNKIMDTVLGYGNFEYVQEKILKPLHLNHTFSSIHDVNTEDIMSGYHEGHPADLKSDDIGMVANAKDIGVFVRALNDGTLFTEKEQKIYASIYESEHSGWVPGYQSFAIYREDLDLVMVAFYSTTDPDLIKWNLAEIINGRFEKIIRRDRRE